MAEPTQFSFELSEIAEMILRSKEIHEGKWVIGLEFGVVVGPVGMKADEGYPGAILTANKLLLTAATGEPQPPNLVFDAALINPKSAKPKRKK